MNVACDWIYVCNTQWKQQKNQRKNRKKMNRRKQTQWTNERKNGCGERRKNKL